MAQNAGGGGVLQLIQTTVGYGMSEVVRRRSLDFDSEALD